MPVYKFWQNLFLCICTVVYKAFIVCLKKHFSTKLNVYAPAYRSRLHAERGNQFQESTKAHNQGTHVHYTSIETWFTQCCMTPGEGALSDATEQGPGREQQSLYLSFPVSGRLTGEVGGSGCGYGV